VIVGALLCSCAAIEIDNNPRPAKIDIDESKAAPRIDSRTTDTQATATPMTGKIAAEVDATTGSLMITVEHALVLAMDNNRSLKVEAVNPAIRRTFESEERAVFDPTISANLSYNKSRVVQRADLGAPKGTKPGNEKLEFDTRDTRGGASINEFLPTGTTLNLGFTTDRMANSGTSGPVYASRVGLSITQRLLQGAGLGVNLASLRQARLDVLSSEYELRGFTESLVANTENAYWDLLLAQRQLAIVQQALDVAESQLNETMERIQFGTLASSERFAAQAEVAQRRETLINGKSQLVTARLALLRLLSPSDSLYDRDILIRSEPLNPLGDPDTLQSHLELGLRMRPDLNQARLAVKRDELELVKTKNGLLPDLDLFITLGKTGYANAFGDSVDDIGDRSNDASLGALFNYPLGNRAPRARHRRAMLSKEQGIDAVDNMEQLVEQDIRDAYIEVNRIKEQVTATSVTRQLQEETLRTEREKFRVGRSTSLLVAQAERDLLAAQLTELQASIAYLKAFVNLYRLDGSLLERRGVMCPGREPVDLKMNLPS